MTMQPTAKRLKATNHQVWNGLCLAIIRCQLDGHAGQIAVTRTAECLAPHQFTLTHSI